jgi:hypothetical protein
MNEIHFLIDLLEKRIIQFEIKNPIISSGNTGWHIEHSLKTIDQIVTACKKSDSTTYRWKFKLNRFLIMDVLHKIPRGKAKAPKVVQPEGDISKESLQLHLEKVQQNLENWVDLNKNCYFTHPFFGSLNKKATEKFLVLHTKHHLQIIEDICN